MSYAAESGYAQTKQATATPRQVERQLLLTIATEIETAKPETVEGYQALAHAIDRNSKLWTALLSDLADQENELTEELRAGLIGLAVYSIRTGSAVLSGKAQASSLVNINRTVAAGLGSQAKVAA